MPRENVTSVWLLYSHHDARKIRNWKTSVTTYTNTNRTEFMELRWYFFFLHSMKLD